MIVESIQVLRLAIPDTVQFSDLKLAWASSGQLEFSWGPIQAICVHNKFPMGWFYDGPEDNVVDLLANWYLTHRANGGEKDAVAEDLLAEVKLEDAAGQPLSYQPGTA